MLKQERLRKFQLEDCESRFQEGEQEEWESQLKIHEHAEDIKTRFTMLSARMGSAEFLSFLLATC